MNNLIEFFIKLFKFIPILWNYAHWDYTFILANMKASTELMLKSYIENEASSESIQELRRFIQLLDNHLKDEYHLIDDVKEAMALEEKEWNELCEIFKGNKELAKYGVKSWWT